MAFNPMVLFKLRGMLSQFKARHPRAVAFVKNEILTGLPVCPEKTIGVSDWSMSPSPSPPTSR